MHGSTKEVIATVAFAFLAMLCASQFPAFTTLQMHTDALVPADFTWDVLHHEYAWSQYQLPRVPSIFPDMLVYGFLQIALGGFGWAMFAYAVVMFLGLSYVCGWFAALLSKRDFFSAVFISEGILSVLFIGDAATAFLGNDQSTPCLHCMFLYPTFHGGPLLAALASVGLICLLLERRRDSETAALYVALYFVATLAMLSDRLTWAEFLAPVLIALVLIGTFFSSTRLRAFSLLILSAISFFTAHILELHVNHVGYPPYNPAKVFSEASESVPYFWNLSVRFFQGHMLSLVCILIPTAFFFLYPFHVIARGEKDMENIRRNVFLWLYMGLAAAFSCFAMIMFLFSLGTSIGSYRYDQLLFFMGVPFITAIALRSKPFSLGMRYFVPGAVALFACIHIGASATLAPGSVSWRPKYADCLDALRGRLGVQAGLATVWNARSLTLASNWKIQVLQGSHRNASPFPWGNDPLSYTNVFAGPYHAPTPRFILMDGIDSLGVADRYGKPDGIERCDGSEIWIYNDPGRFFLNLKK